MWVLASPHAVGVFFIVVLHWMSRLALWYIIKVCFLVCSAPPTHQTFFGTAGQTVNLAINNWWKANIENAIACKATALQLSLVRTPLLGEPARALCIMSKLPFSSSQRLKSLFKLYLFVVPFNSIVVWLRQLGNLKGNSVIKATRALQKPIVKKC